MRCDVLPRVVVYVIGALEFKVHRVVDPSTNRRASLNVVAVIEGLMGNSFTKAFRHLNEGVVVDHSLCCWFLPKPDLDQGVVPE